MRIARLEFFGMHKLMEINDSAMNYLPTLVMFKSAIEKTFSQIKAKEGLEDLSSHLLWMLYEIDNMYDSDKASRWIGYICRCLEGLKIFNNSEI